MLCRLNISKSTLTHGLVFQSVQTMGSTTKPYCFHAWQIGFIVIQEDMNYFSLFKQKENINWKRETFIIASFYTVSINEFVIVGGMLDNSLVAHRIIKLTVSA